MWFILEDEQNYIIVFIKAHYCVLKKQILAYGIFEISFVYIW